MLCYAKKKLYIIVFVGRNLFTISPKSAYAPNNLTSSRIRIKTQSLFYLVVYHQQDSQQPHIQ